MSEPGWHPDPRQRWPVRWWDGQQWTDQVRSGDVDGIDPMHDQPTAGTSSVPVRAQPRRSRAGLWVLGAFVLLCLGGGVAAFASDGDNDSDEVEAGPDEPSTSVSAPPESGPAATAAPTPPPPSPPAEALVPNVVGIDLQSAQDTMQAAGFYFLSSHDLTGQDRFQVVDSNWQVCDQTPAPDAPALTDTAVDFGVVKFGEVCPGGGSAGEPPPSNAPTITADEFALIETGMSLGEVEAIVGGPGEVISETEIAGYTGLIVMWDGEGDFGSNANVQFQDGLVIGKAQFGLG